MTTSPAIHKAVRLSKSRFISGQQCHLRLYNEVFAPELAPPADAGLQAVFDTGHAVGQLATQRYAGGELIAEDWRATAAALAHTQRALESGVPAIFEAALEYQGVLCRVDVLVRAPGGAWDMIEVKSTAHAKEVHVNDLAVQVWIARGAGLSIRHAGVLTLNPEYVYRGGALDVQRLFTLHDRTREVAGLAYRVSRAIVEQKAMLASGVAPKVAPGPHCHTPYACPFYEHCVSQLPDGAAPEPQNPLQQLPRLSRAAQASWAAQGIVDILQLPEDAPLSSLQQRVRSCLVSGRPHVGPGLGPALAALRYPLHHLDFETFMPAIPRYAGTRPFQPLPFQWSNHIEHVDGRIEHHAFLAGGLAAAERAGAERASAERASAERADADAIRDLDPRRECARTLLDSLSGPSSETGSPVAAGSIISYSPYEARVIRDLARDLARELPEYRTRLLALLERIVDLAPIIREHYYHPGFRGSFSLKAILPTLVPHMNYAHLRIGDGSTAQLEYTRMLSLPPGQERDSIRAALLEYCGQDTLGLLEVRRALERAAAG